MGQEVDVSQIHVRLADDIEYALGEVGWGGVDFGRANRLFAGGRVVFEIHKVGKSPADVGGHAHCFAFHTHRASPAVLTLSWEPGESLSLVLGDARARYSAQATSRAGR